MKQPAITLGIVGGGVLTGARSLLPAQQPPTGPDRAVDARERTEVIEGALKHLGAAYVFPETAKKMSEAIRARVERGEYDGITALAHSPRR